MPIVSYKNDLTDDDVETELVRAIVSLHFCPSWLQDCLSIASLDLFLAM